ncbi:MAG: AzlC family ABC transporter permease [Actinomycetota bacterium]
MSGDRRRQVLRDALGIGVATGAYGLSFGAVAIAAGLTVPQACALSTLMFTGASQFALVGVVGAGGAPLAAAASAILLGTRNGLYGLGISRLLAFGGVRRATGAHLAIDESTAMALAHEPDGFGRLGFVATGLSVFLFWNLGTLLGALGARVLPSPERLGLDAAIPAAFIGLLAPRLRGRETLAVAAAGACVALALAPVLPPGIPVLAAALVALAAGMRKEAA